MHILTGNVLTKAIAMISSIVIARLVDKTEYAYFSYADNIFSYIVLTNGLGLSTALLMFCSCEKDKEIEKAYMSYAIRVGGGFEVILSLIVCITASFMDIPYSRSIMYMWALLLYPMLYHVSLCFLSYLRANLENRSYALSGIINSFTTCSLSIILVLLIGIIGIVPARYFALVITILYCSKLFFENTNGVVASTLTREQKSAFLRMGMSLVIASLFSSMMPLNEAFLVNNIIQDEIVTANLRIAGQFPQLLILFSQAIVIYFFPLVTRMTDYREIRRTVIQIGVMNAVFILVLSSLGVLLTPLAFKILYSGKYNDAVNLSYMLWLMNGLNCSLRTVPMNMLPAIGKTKFNMFVCIGSCIIQIVVDYFMVMRLGVAGIIYGSTIVYIVSALLTWTYFLVVCNRQTRTNGN